MLPFTVAERLDRLAPDQREAATSPPGPVLCVAPAGSGKTTTLVARIAWLVATGADPAGITAVTFNKRAADEMATRVDAALEPLGLAAGAVRVKTFHALGREILADGGQSVEPLLDRESVLRDMWPEIDRGTLRRLDDAFSRLKLDVGVTAAQVGTDPEPGPIARAFLAYEAAIEDAGGLEFDDLVARALRVLEARPAVLRRWRERCGHLLVDETQDVDRSQLRLALLLAAPANRIFPVGDDDQSLSKSLPGWRSSRRLRVPGVCGPAMEGKVRRTSEIANMGATWHCRFARSYRLRSGRIRLMKPASELAREAITPQLAPGEQLRSIAAFQTGSAFGFGAVGTLLGGTSIARQEAYWVGITDQRAILVPRNLAWFMAQTGTLDPAKGVISIPLNDVVCTVIPGQPVCLTVPGDPKPQTLTMVDLHGPGWGDGVRGNMDDFLAALKQPPSAEEQLAQSRLTQDEHVSGFYKTTHDAWSRGVLSNLLGTTRQQEASTLELGDFIKKYPPEEGSALRVFFEQFQPREGEFMVVRADLGSPKKRPWFLLTNLRLIQWDGRDDTFREIILAEVQSYQTKKTPKGATLVFKLKTNQEIVFERVPMMPTPKVLMELVHGQGATLPDAPAVGPAPVPSMWMPTHTTPPAGMQAWDVPDPSRPAAIQLPPNLELVVESSTGAWARVRSVNGWQGWVDGSLLVARH